MDDGDGHDWDGTAHEVIPNLTASHEWTVTWYVKIGVELQVL